MSQSETYYETFVDVVVGNDATETVAEFAFVTKHVPTPRAIRRTIAREFPRAIGGEFDFVTTPVKKVRWGLNRET